MMIPRFVGPHLDLLIAAGASSFRWSDCGKRHDNTVFLNASDKILDQLRPRGWKFYTFIGGAARIMFAWDTDLTRVDALIADLEACAA